MGCCQAKVVVGDALHGKVMVISGASQGLGKHLAVAAAGLGALVVVSSRNKARLDAVVAECTAAAGKEGVAAAVPCDVSDRAQCEALVAATVAKFGRLDVMVARAPAGGRPRVQRVGSMQSSMIIPSCSPAASLCGADS